MLENNALTDYILQAAAHEFRRAHQLDGWSHGDPHLNNVLFDGDRARLIDFETHHEVGLPVDVRQADDLLVFLLDLAGRDPTANWQKWSAVFLQTYNNSNVIRSFQTHLIVPTGLELVLWKSRTNYLPTQQLKQRIEVLADLTYS